ncbi:MAG: trypsin-like peptidase domain-containing protein [Chloroflexi bacterium]|nr:trypsin-like peptidase domain-containing protein [Chloroflexota bacterium]
MARLKYGLIAVVLIITMSILAVAGCGVAASSGTSTTDSTTQDINATTVSDSGVIYVDETVGVTLSTHDLVEKVSPAVVSITTETMTTGMFMQAVPTTGAGSGIIIAPEGYIVTNNHVVEDAQTVTVTLSDGRTFEATQVYTDSQTDLAVVHIDATDLPYLHLLNDSLGQLSVLDPLVAVGNALALSGGPTWTTGVVSNLGRTIDLDTGVVLYDLIQTDAAINSGNSGGPLLNMAGQVVGIDTAVASSAENIGFAISTNTAIPVIEALIANGNVVRPALGVQGLTVTSAIAYYYRLSVEQGVLIAAVTSGGAAAEAGLKAGDVITSIDDEEVSTSEELSLAISSHKVGDQVTVGYCRGSQQKTVEVTLQQASS